VTLTWPWTVAAMVGEELTWHSSKYLSNVTNRQPPKIRGLGRRIRGGTDSPWLLVDLCSEAA